MSTLAVTELDELGSLIHDLRQPLNTIQDRTCYLKMLLGNRSALVEEQLRLIERQVDAAAHMLIEASRRMRPHPQCASIR
jgi:signal transduction histidine kinase